MSIFKNLLEKLGLKKTEATAAKAAPKVARPAPAAPAKPGLRGPVDDWRQKPTPESPQFQAAAPAPKPVEMVDVVSKLDQLQKESPMAADLDWKQSIRDLLFLLKMDYSAEGIKELAVELECPESEMSDSARRNMWLHKTVLKKIAENGGNIPESLLK